MYLDVFPGLHASKTDVFGRHCSVVRGWLTAARPCRETQRGLVAVPALSDYLVPVMDSQYRGTGSSNGYVQTIRNAFLPSFLVPKALIEEGDSPLPLR